MTCLLIVVVTIILSDRRRRAGSLDALAVTRNTDLLARVPRCCLRLGDVAQGLQAFDLLVPTPGPAVRSIRHPRRDADPAHRWPREWLASVCRR